MHLIVLLAASAQETAPSEDLPSFEPVEALRDYVAVSTKVTQPAMETPAAVAVISHEEIVRRGYGSVAEALRSIPGFYVTYDLLNYHVAVRGALGGARSGSRLLKVMIDGVPVPFVQSEVYFLGPEFIPMSAVERIEVMRGPVSSLYGAGAYAGAINIVTRQGVYEGQTTVQGELRGMGGAGLSAPYAEGAPPPSQLSVGGDGTVVVRSRDTSFAFGAHVSEEDRSGMAVSPDSVFAPEEPVLSQGDKARPKAFYGRLEQRLGIGRFTALGVAQVSDRVAEFHDLVQLSHDTRQQLYNWKTAVGYEVPFGATGTLRVNGGLAGGGVGPQDRFRLAADANSVIQRELSFLQGTAGAEVRFDIGDSSFVMVGADGMIDQEELPRYTVVFDEGNRSEPYGGATVTLANGGAFVQGLARVGGLTFAGGGRLDLHSVYGVQGAGRLALLYNPSPRVALKFIGGNSFKAASPEQLYATPMTDGDINGDPTIRPQYLFGGETALEVFLTEGIHLSASAFVNRYQDTLGYLLQAGQLVPTSYDADNGGGEVALRIREEVAEGTWIGGQLGVSLQQTVTESTPGLVIQKDFPDNEAVPQVIGYGRVDLIAPRAFVDLALEGWYVSQRTPSQSNLREAGAAVMDTPVYRLAPYTAVDLTLSTPPIPLSEQVGLRLLAKAQNLLDVHYTEIGFNGVDVPAQGRRLFGRVDLTF